jgi:FMN phosphatase YigB (HAD superfamily)
MGRDNGFRFGFAGNHSEETEIALKRFGIDAEIAGSSARWCVEKPDRRFFDRIVGLSGLAPSEICYVGDRLDNDVMGATRAGLGAVWLQRGLWATVQSRWPEAAAVRDKIASLNELEGLFSDA